MKKNLMIIKRILNSILKKGKKNIIFKIYKNLNFTFKSKNKLNLKKSINEFFFVLEPFFNLITIKKGNINLKIPYFLNFNRKNTLVIKWILNCIKKKSKKNKNISKILYNNLIEVLTQKGQIYEKSQEWFKIGIINKNLFNLFFMSNLNGFKIKKKGIITDQGLFFDYNNIDINIINTIINNIKFNQNLFLNDKETKEILDYWIEYKKIKKINKNYKKNNYKYLNIKNKININYLKKNYSDSFKNFETNYTEYIKDININQIKKKYKKRLCNNSLEHKYLYNLSKNNSNYYYFLIKEEQKNINIINFLYEIVEKREYV